MELRVKGHRASHEPRQHNRGQQVGATPGSVICECGQFSAVLPSAIDRIRWHREHLAAVIAGKTDLL